MIELPTAAVDRELVARNGLWHFVRRAWPEVTAAPLVEGWHMELVCKHLEAVSRGEIDRLIINVPPGASKSTITSVLWPAWDWIAHGFRKWMVATFDDALAFRDSMACRKLLRSEWYQERFPEVQLDTSGDAQATQTVWSTIGGGRRYSTTTGGGATGWHSDIQLIDDPTKPKDVLGDPDTARAALEKAWTWFTQTMATRRTGRDFARVIIMQRLHEEDLVGRLLSSDAGKAWTLVMLPMRAELGRRCVTKWGADPRTEEGELLCPERWPQKTVDEIELGPDGLGTRGTAAQNQQRPAPAGGNIFQRDWFRVRWMRPENPKWATLAAGDRANYVPLPSLAAGCLSADCSMKDAKGSDPVALEAWGSAGSKYYLRDCIAEPMGLPGTVACFRALAQRWPWARAKLIENKANGPAVEQVLRDSLSGIIMMEPAAMGGSKVARANAVTPLCQAGSVILPDESEAPWIAGFVEELCQFPFARHDDRVDAMTQALIYLHDRNPAKYLEAMEILRAEGLGG